MKTMVTSESEDAQLVRAFQRGDEVAFSIFVQRHQDRVYRVATMWLIDSSLASDALQETLLRSYTGFSRFRFRSQPQTWLLRVCRNVCREFNRLTVRSQPLAPDHEVEDLASGPDIAEERRRKTTDLRQAISRLPPRQREVVVLRLLEELSVVQTAQVMGCRPGTVKANLHKAMNALRKNSHEL